MKGKLKGRLQDHRERIEQEEPEAAQEAQSNGEDDEVVFVRSVQKSSSKQPQRGAVAARRSRTANRRRTSAIQDRLQLNLSYEVKVADEVGEAKLI